MNIFKALDRRKWEWRSVMIASFFMNAILLHTVFHFQVRTAFFWSAQLLADFFFAAKVIVIVYEEMEHWTI